MADEEVKIKLRAPRGSKKHLENKKIISRINKNADEVIKITQPAKFFEELNKPTESRLYSFIKEMTEKNEEMLDTNGHSRIMEFNPKTGKSRWKLITTTAEFKEAIENSQKNMDSFLKLKEISDRKRYKEDIFGGFGFADDQIGSGAGALPTRSEFTPLISSPFFKQMYLYDYWAMHSKCFWFKNYSGIAKLVIDMTRNFVLGKGFNVDFDDEKAQEAWNEYEDRSNIQEEIRSWCDDLTWSGELMLKRIPTKDGIMHRPIDPSTIWEIITDPEDISDIKYYHQQYNTQYQLYGDGKTPLSKYIINQIPPEFIIHSRVNVTPYEKRGRSDLLSVLLYFKYHEDYMQARLARAKNEAAFIWDVEIDGSDEDVLSYIQNSENMTDVPPGSENVHNKAIKRTPLSPQFSASNSDEIAKDILGYVAMGVTIPSTYFGTFDKSGGATKAGALVSTEPVAKKMLERQYKLEWILRRIVKDVLIGAGLDPKDPKNKFEINFPEIMEEDRSQKIQDIIVSDQAGYISHQTAAIMTAKELRITKYDYESEQAEITKQGKDAALFMQPPGSSNDGLTPGGNKDENKPERSVDRKQIKKDGNKF